MRAAVINACGGPTAQYLSGLPSPALNGWEDLAQTLTSGQSVKITGPYTRNVSQMTPQLDQVVVRYILA